MTITSASGRLDRRRASTVSPSRLGIRLAQRGLAVPDRRDLIARFAQALLEDPSDPVFVVGEEDLRTHLLRDRQEARHRRAASLDTVDLDGSLVLLEDPMTEREPESEP